MRVVFSFHRLKLLGVATLAGVALASGSHAAEKQASEASFNEAQLANEFVQNYCLDCHNESDKTAELNLEAFDAARPASLSIEQLAAWDPTAWEKMVTRIRARQMPPADSPRPEEKEYHVAVTALENVLDRAADRLPRPGRTDTLRRLNRTEYQNAIRDLLALNIDAAELLPADQEAHGFDNVTLGGLTPVLLSRYVSAAEVIARQAIGGRERTPGGKVYRLPPDRTQLQHVPGLPLGTRGGALFDHHFPQTGEYEVRVRLARDRDEHVEGLHAKHEIDVLLDNNLVQQFAVEPTKDQHKIGYEHVNHSLVDAHLHTRFRVTAGSHKLGVTFPRKGYSLNEIKRQPFDAAFNRHRHPRPEPAVFEVSITGPFAPQGPGDTEPRRRVFARTPPSNSEPAEAAASAEASLRRLMRFAYRRPVTNDDLAMPMRFYRRGAEASGTAPSPYEAGMQLALTAVLVNPHFLIRTEGAPHGVDQGEAYRVTDLQLASRLSFFLWSSLPDDELLDLAEARRLSEPKILTGQVRRMLADRRSESLVTNFAAQWLHLRNLASLRPDMRRFPDFDDNLRQAMRRETELLFASLLRDDRSVLDLITTDTTYLNERLATHYDVPGVIGSHFRPVKVSEHAHRGGLLRHGSILAVTSYATRTAPTIRGAWVLDNLVGTPPPPPPPNVENLKDEPSSVSLTMRERLAKHRKNPACASCHDLIDPIGFALENYDAVGRWRDLEGETAVDASGVLPDGSQVNGVAQLEAGIAAHPEVFVTALAEKLLTFALGRGVEAHDAPAIRKAVRRAADNDYKFSSLIEGLVASEPFLMREAE